MRPRAAAWPRAAVAAGLLLLATVGGAHAQRTVYFDEPSCLAALAAQGYTASFESFEADAVWGLLRADTAPDASHFDVTWTGFGGGVAVDDLPFAHDGSWELASAPAGFPAGGIVGPGAALAIPALPLALPLRVQMQASNGACFAATLSSLLQNTPERFRAESG